MRSFLAFAALLAVLALIIPFGAALALPGSLPTGPAQPAASRTGPPQAPSENPAVSIPDSGSGGTEKTGSSVPGLWRIRHRGIRFIRFGAVLDGGQGNRQLSCL